MTGIVLLMRRFMEGLDSECFGRTRNPRGIRTFHGGILTVACFQRILTSRPLLSLRCAQTRRRGRKRSLRITVHSKSLYASTWRASGEHESRRFSDTIMTAGSLRPTRNFARGSTKNTNQIMHGFVYVLVASPSGVLTRSAVSSRVRNIFFLHQ